MEKVVSRVPITTLLLFGAADFIASIDSTGSIVALPSIERLFGVNESSGHWILTAFALGLVLALFPVTYLMSRRSPSLLYKLGLLLFTLSALVIALSPWLSVVIAARFLQGLSTAILYTAPLVIIVRHFPTQRQKAFTITSVMMGLGLIGGPVLAGIFASSGHCGWRLFFGVSSLLSLVVCVMLYRFEVPEKKDDRSATPFSISQHLAWSMSLAIAVIGLSAYSYGAVYVVMTWIGTIAFIAQCLNELYNRHSKDSHNLSMLRNQTVFTLNLLSFSTMVIANGLSIIVSLYLQQKIGMNSMAVGILVLPAPLACVISSVLSGYFKSVRLAAFTAGSLAVLGVCSTSVAVCFDGVVVWVIIGLGLIGASCGILMARLVETLLTATSDDALPNATALFNLIQQCGVLMSAAYVTSRWSNQPMVVIMTLFVIGLIGLFGSISKVQKEGTPQ